MSLTKVTYDMIKGGATIMPVAAYGVVSYPDKASAIAGGDAAPGIQACIDANGVAVLPPGNYYINSTIILDGGEGILGIGNNSVYLYAGPALTAGGLSMIESVGVRDLVPRGVGGIFIEGLFMFGGDDATAASGIEIGCRTVGGGTTFNLARLGGRNLRNGVRINNGQFSNIDDLNFVSTESKSSGFGVQFTGLTGGITWTGGLIANYRVNIEVTQNVTINGVNTGTAADGAYGPGWTNTWTSNLLVVRSGNSCEFNGVGFEYLTNRPIDEALLNSLAGTSSGGNVFNKCHWAGVTGHAGHRIRIGDSAAGQEAVTKTWLVDCDFITGAPSDIYIENGENTVVDRCTRLSNYYDLNANPAVITFATGDFSSTKTWINVYGSRYPFVIGQAGSPAFQNGYTVATLNPAFEPVQYYIDNSWRVNLSGNVQRGTAVTGNVVFTLGFGYRPTLNVDFPIIDSNAVIGVCRILSNGNVQLFFTGAPTDFSLSGISFKAQI